LHVSADRTFDAVSIRQTELGTSTRRRSITPLRDANSGRLSALRVPGHPWLPAAIRPERLLQPPTHRGRYLFARFNGFS
jgi:hypothetical protein